MPTKKKRVGFIPREDVMKIIDMLSVENNLSNSKIIGILVEEALSLRGIFNKRSGKLTQSYQKIIDNSQDLIEDSVDYKFTRNTKFGNYINSDKTNPLKQIDQVNFDQQTYEKFMSFLKFQQMMEKFDN
tara:strand:+ start:40 stop:426 length:387 start_codon:yes stop_codon:yes gene_type:complete